MKSRAAFVIVGIIGAFGFAQATDYCGSSLCRDAPHIGCNNSGTFSSTCPKDKELILMTDDLKYAIVKRHNSYRNTLAAGNLPNFLQANQMATMSWNKELAYLAELNVKRCVFGYDLCHNTASFKFCGQNVAKSLQNKAPPTDEASIIALIDSWWAQNQYSNMEYIRNFPDNLLSGNRIMQFMVMALDRNTAVGCAAIKYKDPNFSYWNTFILTCNYARANLISATTYVVGPATSNCTTGNNINYPALCSPNEPIDPNSYTIIYL